MASCGSLRFAVLRVRGYLASTRRAVGSPTALPAASSTELPRQSVFGRSLRRHALGLLMSSWFAIDQHGVNCGV